MKQLFSFVLLMCGLTFGVHAQDIFVENFDGATIPTGWSQTTLATDGGWKFGGGNSSQYFTIPNPGSSYASTNDDGCNCDKSADRLISPAFDATTAAGQTLVLELDQFFYGNTYQGATETAKLQYSTDGGTTWTQIADIPGNTANSFQNQYVVISSITSYSNVHLSVLYNDGGGWLFGYGLNKVRAFVAPNVVSLKAETGSVGKFVSAIPSVIPTTSFLTGDMASGSMTVQSLGGVTITSFKVETTYNGASTTKTVSGLSIAPFGTHTFDLDEWAVVAGNQTATIEITEVNGSTDSDLTDNTITQTITGVTPLPNKRVFAEEGTGTWCGWCPRGKVMMDWMVDNYADHFIGVMVHNGGTNPMTVTEYDSGLGIEGFPGCQIDRVSALKDSDPLEFYENMVAQVTKDPIANLSLYGSVSGSTATITVGAEFTTAFSGGRLNLVLYENEVTGTTSAWNQSNFYAGGGAGPMGGWETKPSSVSGEKFDYTARALAEGMNGNAASLPANVNAGETHEYTYNMNLGSTWNVDNIYVVGILVKNSTGVIHNAFARKLSEVVNIEDIKALRNLQVYPNPASDLAFVELSLDQPENVSINVVNVMGQILLAENQGVLAGTQSVRLNTSTLPAGTYMVQIQVGKEFVTRALQIVR